MATIKEVKDLVQQKVEVERELDELHSVLESHGSNMTDELVDPEGYPRADIDVLTVRKTRVRIIYLQSDLKQLLGKIEKGLYKIHADEREKRKTGESAPPNVNTTDQNAEPFLKIDLVSEGSPAEKAGLKLDDLIVRFGSLTCENYTGLQMIGSLVQHSKEKNIEIAVKRNGKLSNLILTPSTWSGRGLLGCNIVLYKK